MKHLILLIAIGYFSFLSFSNAQIQTDSRNPFSIGETVEIFSEVLKEKRTLNVYLPATYGKDSTKTYPVIYLLDGSADEDFIHIAGLVQFGTFSWINMLPESILIGIGNVDRRRDFTYPTNNKEDKEAYPTTGASAAFIQFIEQELQQWVKQEYAVADTKTIIGQSLGGLLATEILFKHPALFDNYVIVSPSLWWDDESALDWQVPQLKSKKQVYVAGGKEGEVMERTAKALYNMLNAKASTNLQAYYKFLEAQDHGDALHLAVYDAFEKIFAKPKD